MKTRKQILEFEVIDHGIEHEQYFQGCGVSFTKFDSVGTGIGSSAAEAFSDAVDSLAQQGYDVEKLEEEQIKYSAQVEDITEDCYHYISIRVKNDEN